MMKWEVYFIFFVSIAITVVSSKSISNIYAKNDYYLSSKIKQDLQNYHTLSFTMSNNSIIPKAFNTSSNRLSILSKLYCNRIPIHYRYIGKIFFGYFTIVTASSGLSKAFNKIYKSCLRTFVIIPITFRILDHIWLKHMSKKLMKLMGSNSTQEYNFKVHNIVNEIMSRSNLSYKPQICILPEDDFASALAVPKNGIIFISKSIVEKFPTPEIRAIIAHEYGHIKHYDTLHELQIRSTRLCGFDCLYISSIKVITSLITIVKSLLMTKMKGNIDDFIPIDIVNTLTKQIKGIPIKEKLNVILGLVCTTSSIVINRQSKILHYNYSRYAEYKADEYAADICGKEAMISALQRLDNNWLYDILYSLKILPTPTTSITDTHPLTSDRIKRLQNRTQNTYWNSKYIDAGERLIYNSLSTIKSVIKFIILLEIIHIFSQILIDFIVWILGMNRILIKTILIRCFLKIYNCFK